MTSPTGHIIFAFAGAGLGGLFAYLLAPSVFWACLIGGALTGGALRVGYVLMTAGVDE